MTKIYFIGGSPCSGKSTIAEKLAEKYNLFYFKVDDHLEEYTARGALNDAPICKKQREMSPEEIWMRDPTVQCTEELQFYEEVFDFVMQDLKKIQNKSDIITEGAAFLPHLMKRVGVSLKDYLSITPSEEFQIEHYVQRDWIYFVLEGCKDKEQAFHNWMQRDILFAEKVQAECLEDGYCSYVNNGQLSIDELVHKAACHYGWEE